MILKIISISYYSQIQSLHQYIQQHLNTCETFEAGEDNFDETFDLYTTLTDSVENYVTQVCCTPELINEDILSDLYSTVRRTMDYYQNDIETPELLSNFMKALFISANGNASISLEILKISFELIEKLPDNDRIPFISVFNFIIINTPVTRKAMTPEQELKCIEICSEFVHGLLDLRNTVALKDELWAFESLCEGSQSKKSTDPNIQSSLAKLKALCDFFDAPLAQKRPHSPPTPPPKKSAFLGNKMSQFRKDLSKC